MVNSEDISKKFIGGVKSDETQSRTKLFKRAFSNALFCPLLKRKAVSNEAISIIRNTVRESEKLHSGELVVCIEQALNSRHVLAGGLTSRGRALELFSHLRVWDTSANNGVLLYLLLAEHTIEIVADRGLAAHVPEEDWKLICQEMRPHLMQDKLEHGIVEGVKRITDFLVRHFPDDGTDVKNNSSFQGNQLPDSPIIMR
jgi:hypothetical protein